MRTIPLFPLAALVLAACQDNTEPSGPTEQFRPQAEIQDAVHNDGNQYFYFLPPMVPDPSPTGVFDGSLAPEVEICDLTASCATSLATFTTTTGPGSETVRVNTVDESYIVNWHTNEFSLDAEATYRIIVSVDGQELGSRMVELLPSDSGSRKEPLPQLVLPHRLAWSAGGRWMRQPAPPLPI
jgi:hypothetical protein